jgi:CDP-diacylglycerol--serine O-phosphatidyltransferase
MPRPAIRRPDVRRAAPALPNGFTLGNLFFGIFAIVSAARGDFSEAVLYIVLGGVCDAFDGRVARATGTGSRFGEELDSLVDGISFGLAPGMITYFAVLHRDGWGWFPVFIFTACAVLRLARFNVTQAGRAKTYFQGLPSPAAGGTLATYFWFSQTTLYQQTFVGALPWNELMKYLMIVLAFLMVSNVPYPAWPKIGLRSWQGVLGLVFTVVTVLGVTFYAKYYFFLAGIAYVVFGLARAVILGLLDLRAAPPEPDEEEIIAMRRTPRRTMAVGAAGDTHRAAPLAPGRIETSLASERDDESELLVDGGMADGEAAPRKRRRRRRRPRGDRPADDATGERPAPRAGARDDRPRPRPERRDVPPTTTHEDHSG